MNSKFTVTDSSGYSPLDLGVAEVMRVPPPSQAATASKKGKGTPTAKEAQHFKVFTQPKVQ